MNDDEFVVRPGTADDAPAMRELFAEVFGHPMPPGLWEWKYGDGRGHSFLGSDREGKIVAHYGGFPRPLAVDDEIWPGLQIGDVMVSPKANAGLQRRGLFWKITSGFFEAEVGLKKAYRFAFGFPNRRHHLAGERLKLYEEVDAVMDVTVHGNNKMPRLWSVGRLAEPDMAWRVAADELWCRMRASLPGFVLPVRSADYLEHRYFRHPVFEYQLFLARRTWTGTPLAMWVLMARDGWIELVDLIAERGRMAAALNAIALHGRSCNQPVRGWMTRSAAALLPSTQISAQTVDVPIAQSVWPAGTDMAARTRGRWWLMGGDTDFH